MDLLQPDLPSTSGPENDAEFCIEKEDWVISPTYSKTNNIGIDVLVVRSAFRTNSETLHVVRAFADSFDT
jgi:hypothetical protein